MHRCSKYLLAALLLAFLTVNPPATAEDTPADAPLRDLVLRLETRVSELEAELDRLKTAHPPAGPTDGTTAPAPAGELASRVEALESRVEAEDAPETFRMYWRAAPRFETNDGRVKLKLGAMLQIEAGWLDAGQDLELAGGTLEDQAALRRARLTLSGTLYDDFYFESGYDFSEGDADFLDNFVGIKNVPVAGNLEVGHRKEPMGLERLASAAHGTFLELSQPTSVFTPNRNTGFTLHNAVLNERLTWALGTFRDTDNYGNGGSDGDYSVTARLTGLPWYADDGRRLLHVGAGVSHRNLDGTLRYQSRSETNLNDFNYLDTGGFLAAYANVYNFELALQTGRFWAMGEYFLADVETGGDDRRFDGFYLASGLFLTPDHRSYKTNTGVFGGVHPRNNFTLRPEETRGWGAWEVAARYSALDLNSGLTIRGGEQENWSAILNWYLNPNMRAALSYIHSDVERDLYEGSADALQLRIQFAM